MKKLLFYAMIMFIAHEALSQSSPVLSDNFESYPAGSYLAVQNPTLWTTWSNLPGSPEDGVISTSYASSGTKSVLIDAIPAPTDLVLKLGNRTTGKYELNWKMYLENTCGGYYNLQHFETPGVEWACEVWFNGDGTGAVYVGNAFYPFNYPHGSWFLVQHIIDLDHDMIKLLIGGFVVHEWPFSHLATATGGTNQLGSVDFYATTFEGSTPKYFVDDVNLMQYLSDNYYYDSFEIYTPGEFIAMENPTWWKTWSALPGSYQDGVISSDHASSGTNSILIDNIPAETDLVLKLANRTSGNYNLKWKMYFENACGGYYNIQHFEEAGIEWACEVWFNGNGSGVVYTGTTSYPFNFPHGSWFMVENFISLDANQIILVVNGVPVHAWQFSNIVGSASGTNQLGSVDFYASTLDGSVPKYYIDDVLFTETPAIIPLEWWSMVLAIGLILLFVMFLWWRKR